MKRSPLHRKTPLKRSWPPDRYHQTTPPCELKSVVLGRRGSKKKPPKKKTLKPLSSCPKKREERKKYKTLREDYLRNHPTCECGTEADPCKETATEIHHKAGRASFLNRVDTWMAVARKCHNKIHDNPKESYAKEHLINSAALYAQESQQTNE